MGKWIRILLINLLIIVWLVSCESTKTPSPIPENALITTLTLTPVLESDSTSSPLESTGIALKAITGPGGLTIWPYDDVRDDSLRSFNIELGESMIQSLWFNMNTRWSEQNLETALDILEKGKNPGLGVRSLHAQGITGMGVSVAIIDQHMHLDHPEFEGKIIKYFDVGTNRPPDDGSMHGPAVTSLLVGENTGTAPGATVYYVAAPSWETDAQYYADALDWIINENDTLLEDSKIRVVSVSAVPSGEGTPFKLNNSAWDEAYQRALNAGILVLDCTTHHGLTALCMLDLENPDDFSRCIPGWSGEEGLLLPDRIYIPTSHRTTAEEYAKGFPSYQYTGIGGLSWSIPYLAGVLAMGWQVDPGLSNDEIIDYIFQSAYVTEENVKIINPVAFINLIKKNMSK
jgi:serine protease AprX